MTARKTSMTRSWMTRRTERRTRPPRTMSRTWIRRLRERREVHPRRRPRARRKMRADPIHLRRPREAPQRWRRQHRPGCCSVRPEWVPSIRRRACCRPFTPLRCTLQPQQKGTSKVMDTRTVRAAASALLASGSALIPWNTASRPRDSPFLLRPRALVAPRSSPRKRLLTRLRLSRRSDPWSVARLWGVFSPPCAASCAIARALRTYRMPHDRFSPSFRCCTRFQRLRPESSISGSRLMT